MQSTVYVWYLQKYSHEVGVNKKRAVEIVFENQFDALSFFKKHKLDKYYVKNGGIAKSKQKGFYQPYCCRRKRIQKGRVFCESHFSIHQAFPYMEIDGPTEKKPFAISGPLFHDHEDQVIYQRVSQANKGQEISLGNCPMFVALYMYISA